jgi:hypothetical protein
MEAETWELVMAVHNLVAMRFWFGDLWFGATPSKSGDDNTRKINSMNLQSESPRFGLNWLCLAITLLRYRFVSADFILRENVRSTIRAMTSFMYCLLLESIAFAEVDFWCCLGGTCYSGDFLFLQLLSFLWLYASILPLEQWFIAEARCTNYLRGINIYFFWKKEKIILR